MTRQWVTPHLVEFEPQLREAFLTLESYFAELDSAGASGQPGIVWWDGNGAPTTSSLPNARGGDFYIDRLNGDVYRLLADDYTRSLGGSENESRAVQSGSMWWDGTTAPSSTGDPYRVQDYWLNTTTCDIWRLS